jgi:hypothetical protein
MSIPLIHDGDTVLIGEPRAFAARPAGLEVAGGMLWVDPLDPACSIMEIAEPDQAQESVVALFGLDAWVLVTRGADGLVDPGWALADARRLAIVDWLRTHSPDSLDDDLLSLQACVLARRCGLDREMPHLHDRAAQMLRGPAAAGMRSLAAEFLQVPEPDTEVRALPWSLDSVLSPLTEGLVLDADTHPTGGWQTGGLDWDLVPRGAFDSAEDAVRWRVNDSQVQIEVKAGPRPAGDFIARLLHDDSSLPGALVPLRFDGGIWTGTATAFGATDDSWVDVTSAADPRPARRGVARQQASARRWAVRAATRMRFALSDRYLLDCAQPLTQAIGCLERARIGYAEASGRDDQRRQFELGLTLRAALIRAGADYEVDDLDSELILESSQGSGTTVGFDDPAWELTVAERALLVPDAGD